MRALEPLRHGPLARLWVGQSLSAIGDQVQRMAVIWLAVDIGLAVLSLVLLALAALRLWRSVKGFTRAAGDAGDAMGAASDRLAAAQAEGPRRR